MIIMHTLPKTSDLSQDLLHWIADAVGPGTTVETVHRLKGATSSTLYAVDAARNGHRVELVLRRFTNREWLAEEPDLALHEAESLHMARRAGVSAPELVAIDQRSEQDGIPILLMTRLPGTVELLPDDLDGWLHRLAEAILPLHSLDAAEFGWRYASYNDVTQLKAPGWSSCPDLWERAIEIVNGPWPGTPTCFIHRDYHPTNVLWQETRISGIVDWVNACRGPASVDLSHCRGNLKSLYGVEIANRFLNVYQSLVGGDFEHHPYWDLSSVIGVLPGPPDVYPPWIEFGVDSLNKRIMAERADEYLVSVMARF